MYPQAFGWLWATANWKGPWLHPVTALLLACTAAVLHQTGVEGRSWTASNPGVYAFERRLASVNLPAGIPSEGWTLGRASYSGPPDSFTQNFTGKCYELRCVNSIVPGNYSSDGIPVPYKIGKDQLIPVYDFPSINNTPPLDDYGRIFPGNVLIATRQMFTQCWNQTQDAQGLLSPTESIFVQVADTCTCQHGSSDACCTNIPHFNLHYQAFQKLAHPDYGLLNLMFRPVDCITKAALPLEPGFVNMTIYQDQLGTGWGVGGSANKMLQQPQGLSGSNATCFDLWKDSDELIFFCRECDRAGYQPFLLSNTSGLQFYIKQTGTDDGSEGSVQTPKLKMTLGNVKIVGGKVFYTELCPGSAPDITQLVALGKEESGMQKVSALYQNNFRGCVRTKGALGQLTSFRFQTIGATSKVSFCLDDIALLPTTLQPAGITVPDYPKNCFIPMPVPIDQDGNYIAGVQPQSLKNLTDYTVFPLSDLQNRYDMNPVLGTCFANNSGLTIPGLVQEVNSCTEKYSICCYNAEAAQESDVPDTLAQICNDMATNGSICLGFVYDASTKIAFFTGAGQYKQIDRSSSQCLYPNTTVWLLNTAVQSQQDVRPIAKISLDPMKPACKFSPDPSNEELQRLASTYTLPADVVHDVLASASTLPYSVTPHADLQGMLFSPCSLQQSTDPANPTYAAAVQTCTSRKNGTCCVSYPDQLALSVDGTLPDTLAAICNSIRFEPASANFTEYCQGFVYDVRQQVAFFKAQPDNRLLGVKDMCSNPTTYTWLHTQDRTGVPIGPGLSPPPVDDKNKTQDDNDKDKNNTGETIGTVAGVLGTVAGGGVACFTWFAVTYSYRMDKHMVVKEVVRNLKVEDVASVTQGITPQQQGPSSRASLPLPLAIPVAQSRNLHSTRSMPSRGAPSLQSDVSQRSRSSSSNSSSMLLFPPAHRASMRSSDSDAVANPLLLVPGLSPDRATPQTTHRSLHDDNMLAPSSEMKAVARQITVRCLRRWDGFLGIRASTDGTGRPSGIWRDKFDGVHYAVLLLAMRKLNEALSTSDESCSIETAWREGDRKQRDQLLNQLVRVLQSISEEEAQALPDKDPERPGMYDKLCSMMSCCGS